MIMCVNLVLNRSLPVLGSCLMVKPHQSQSERESDVALLVSYIMQFTCHTKRKRFETLMLYNINQLGKNSNLIFIIPTFIIF